MSSFLTNVMRLALKMAVQLASHAWPMENRGTCTFGIRWHTFHFAVGRWPFDTPCIRSELAVVIWIPLGVMISLVSGVFRFPKWMVHPESAAIRCSVSCNTWNGLFARLENAKFLHEEVESK